MNYVTRSTIIKKLRKFKKQSAEKYGILLLGIFGSVARDEATELSDVDVVIQLETANLFTIVHIKEDIEKELSLPVDIVRLRDKMNPFLKKRIEKEAVYV